MSCRQPGGGQTGDGGWGGGVGETVGTLLGAAVGAADGAAVGDIVRGTALGAAVDRPMWCRRMCVATHLLVLAFGDKVAHWKQLLCALLAHLLHTQCVAPKAAALCFPRGQGMQRAMAFRG